ncbi:hypothetical protein D3C81_1687450 [compost metagenome]
MAVDHVVGEEHRDLQPALGGGILHRPVFRAGDRVEGTADAPGGDFLADHFTGHFRADADQAQLADLFIQGHLLDQVGDERLFVLQRGGRGVGKGRVTGQADNQTQQTQLVHEFCSQGLRQVDTAQPKLGKRLLL